MSDLQNRIVESLTNSFILDRSIDPNSVAEVLRKEFPAVDAVELVRSIKRVASGIGVHIKE